MAITEDELRPHLGSLRQYARLLARDPHRADDLVQEAITRFCISYKEGRELTNIQAYLRRILHNVWCDEAKNWRKRAAVSIDDVVPAEFSVECDPTHSLVMRDLHRAFIQLPQGQQDVLALVALEGLSYQETASALGVPIGTVMSRLSRARAALKTALEG